MDKIYTSLGLMSGTSLDGIDASIIISDGEKLINIEENQYFAYTRDFQSQLRDFINECDGIEFVKKNKETFNDLERELTLLHRKISDAIIMRYKKNIDFVGFHGQTITHQPKKKYSIQMGDAKLLSQLLKKKIIYDFRANDIENNGNGAPLACIYHYNLSKKLNLFEPVIFLNIGGISNITYVNGNQLIAKDIGPGNVLIDEYIKKNSTFNYDKDGKIALRGKINHEIIKFFLETELQNLKKKKSLDRKDFSYQFINGLEFNDAVATLTYLTANIISIFLNENYETSTKIILCGGGRKNTTLINHIKYLSKKKITRIDDLGIDGDYIESQAFAYLSIRSILKKNISFPQTTNSPKPLTGGKLIKNF